MDSVVFAKINSLKRTCLDMEMDLNTYINSTTTLTYPSYNFGSLPTEIYSDISKYFAAIDMMNMAQTSARLKFIFDQLRWNSITVSSSIKMLRSKRSAIPVMPPEIFRNPRQYSWFNSNSVKEITYIMEDKFELLFLKDLYTTFFRNNYPKLKVFNFKALKWSSLKANDPLQIYMHEFLGRLTCKVNLRLENWVSTFNFNLVTNLTDIHISFTSAASIPKWDLDMKHLRNFYFRPPPDFLEYSEIYDKLQYISTLKSFTTTHYRMRTLSSLELLPTSLNHCELILDIGRLSAEPRAEGIVSDFIEDNESINTITLVSNGRQESLPMLEHFLTFQLKRLHSVSLEDLKSGASVLKKITPSHRQSWITSLAIALNSHREYRTFISMLSYYSNLEHIRIRGKVKGWGELLMTRESEKEIKSLVLANYTEALNMFDKYGLDYFQALLNVCDGDRFKERRKRKLGIEEYYDNNWSKYGMYYGNNYYNNQEKRIIGPMESTFFQVSNYGKWNMKKFTERYIENSTIKDMSIFNRPFNPQKLLLATCKTLVNFWTGMDHSSGIWYGVEGKFSIFKKGINYWKYYYQEALFEKFLGMRYLREIELNGIVQDLACSPYFFLLFMFHKSLQKVELLDAALSVKNELADAASSGDDIFFQYIKYIYSPLYEYLNIYSPGGYVEEDISSVDLGIMRKKYVLKNFTGRQILDFGRKRDIF